MKISFTKYQGTGNDFVVIDNRSGHFPKTDRKVIARLCDRRFGIGADGLMLIEDHEQLDFRMIYFNSDGSQSLCGNGSRCAVSFARTLSIIGDSTHFETTDGVHDAFFEGNRVHFHLHDVGSLEKIGSDFFIDTGSPHYVRFVEDIEEVDVVREGREIRYSSAYAPGGTNVNFVEAGDPLKARTYERGVEAETLSCGTGVTAVAIAAASAGRPSPVHISTRGGDLSVSFRKEGDTFTDLYLSGPATRVFAGEVDI